MEEGCLALRQGPVSYPGLMTLVEFGGDRHLRTECSLAVLCHNRACIRLYCLIFGRCSRCRNSSLLDASLAWRVASCWSAPHGSRPCREGGSRHGEHPNGTLLSVPRAVVSVSQVLILLLSKGESPADGQVEPSPSRTSLSSPPPGL